MSPAITIETPRSHLLGEEPYIDLSSPSDPLNVVFGRILEAQLHFFAPISRQERPVEELFRDLSLQWQSEVRFLSSTTEIAMHPAYQRIIALGWSVVPFILQDVEAGAGRWFWALKAITGVDPVDIAHRGNREHMASAWLRWAREKGITW